MTSRGRKALSVTCGDSSPKGRAKASYIGTRNGAYLYRYAPFTVLRYPSMRVPPESRMVVKRFPTSPNARRKCLAPSQKVSHLRSLSQREAKGFKKWSVSVSIRSIPVLRLPLNARAARKSDGRKSTPCLSLWVGGQRSEDGEGK